MLKMAIPTKKSIKRKECVWFNRSGREKQIPNRHYEYKKREQALGLQAFSIPT